MMLIMTYNNNNKDPIMIHNVYVCTAGYVYMHVDMCRGQMRAPDALELVISCPVLVLGTKPNLP